MTDVFVSYARSDKARVAPLVAALEAQGWSVWWDPAIAPGQEFDRTITAELARASSVLVVWTHDSVESRWVRGEARDAADRGILVPLRIGNPVLPIDCRALHTIDLAEGGDPDGGPAFREVVRALGALIGAAAEPAEPAPSGTAGPALERRPSAPVRVGICVLPFANLGGDPEQDFFTDGITGDIITELSRWRMLAVRSRSASFLYRGGTADPMRVARELDVRYVVEGSVRRLGNRIRISVQLIDGETGAQVWGEKFDREQSAIFEVQDQVVQTIVSTLVGRVQMTDAERARRKPPSSLAAYECVQRGNALPWDDPQSAIEAIRLFEQAIALDPGYAIAHALLGTMRIGRYHNDPASSTAARDGRSPAPSGRSNSTTATAPAIRCSRMPACTDVRTNLLCSTCAVPSRSIRTIPGTGRTWGSCSPTRVRPKKRCPGSRAPATSTPTSTRPGTGAWPARPTWCCGSSNRRSPCLRTFRRVPAERPRTWRPAAPA
jgi:TolB-like protein